MEGLILRHVQACAATNCFCMASHKLKMYGWSPDLIAVPLQVPSGAKFSGVICSGAYHTWFITHSVITRHISNTLEHIFV